MVCNYNHWYNARGGEQDLACIESLRWAIHWGLSKVILESDCAWVAARISNHVVDRSEEGPVIEEIRSLSCLVEEFKVSQVKRDCNQVANAVANLARRTKHSAAWWGQAPACAQDHLIADCINAGV